MADRHRRFLDPDPDKYQSGLAGAYRGNYRSHLFSLAIDNNRLEYIDMANTLKIVIPTAGWATRIRPHSWSKPKPLIALAGKTTFDYLINTFQTIPSSQEVDYIIIVEPHLGDKQIPLYMKEHYGKLNASFVVQEEMRGQSDALWQARQHLTGPILMCFADTLLETDFSFLATETAEVVAWVKSVPDPRRFGVAEIDQEGRVTRLIEKPQTLENKLVVVGCYYFQSGEVLISAIEEQIKRKIQLRGEYYLVDAINILLERGARMRTQEVDVWLDTGTIEATLETNRYLLEHQEKSNQHHSRRAGVKVIPPVFIHENAEITESIIGPNVSIASGCKISRSRIEDSILEQDVIAESIALKYSIIGRQAQIKGQSAKNPPFIMNIGDDSSVTI